MSLEIKEFINSIILKKNYTRLSSILIVKLCFFFFVSFTCSRFNEHFVSSFCITCSMFNELFVSSFKMNQFLSSQTQMSWIPLIFSPNLTVCLIMQSELVIENEL